MAIKFTFLRIMCKSQCFHDIYENIIITKQQYLAPSFTLLQIYRIGGRHLMSACSLHE